MLGNIESEDITLTCDIGEDNIIYLKMGGNLLERNIDKFHAWANDLKGAMVAVSQIDKSRVWTLIEVSPTSKIDRVVSGELHELMKFNGSYATRTAVYGLGPFTETVVRTAIILTHRYTMKPFSTREEAVYWLTHGELLKKDDAEKQK